jgi:hypothetical protein
VRGVKELPRPIADLLLGAFAVAVVIGAAAAVKQSNAAPASLSTQPVAVSTPSATPTAKPSPTSSTAARSVVVLAGPDLAKLRQLLATRTGYTVEVVAAAPPAVLAPTALTGLTVRPSTVVLEVLAGSKTTLRTAAAITAVRAKWPGTHVVVVGPFSSADRLSAAAAKSAAVTGKAVFLDPVLLNWRVSATSATLAEADLSVVTDQLAAALA